MNDYMVIPFPKIHRGKISAGHSCLFLGICPSSGKRQYATLRQAKKTTRAIAGDHSMHAYQCEACNFYHIGHKSKRPQRVDTPEVDTSEFSTAASPAEHGLRIVATLTYGRHSAALFQATGDSSLLFFGEDTPPKRTPAFQSIEFASLTPLTDGNALIDLLGATFGKVLDTDIERASVFVETCVPFFRTHQTLAR